MGNFSHARALDARRIEMTLSHPQSTFVNVLGSLGVHANPTLFGWGSLDPMELFHHYSGKAAGVEYYNPGYYSNPAVEAHMGMAA